MHGWMCVWMDGWMDGRMDRMMGGWMDGWMMGGWMDGWMEYIFVWREGMTNLGDIFSASVSDIPCMRYDIMKAAEHCSSA